MKRTVPLFIAALAGFVIIFSTFIPAVQEWGDDAMLWFDVLAVAAFILGGGNLLKVHLRKISDQKAGWAFSVVTVLAFLATLVVGLGLIGVNPSPEFADRPWSGYYIEEGGAFWWAYTYAVYPLTSTMFAMLAFYVASAAYRAFRAKNVEATLLLGTAFIVLLGQTYAGVVLTGWIPDVLASVTGWEPEAFNTLRLDNLTAWIMDGPNTAGNRAIMIGIALGIVSTSLKILLGIDRSYLGSE